MPASVAILLVARPSVTVLPPSNSNPDAVISWLCVTAPPEFSVRLPDPTLVPLTPLAVPMSKPLLSRKDAVWLAVDNANVATLFDALASAIVPVPVVDARKLSATIAAVCVRLPLVPARRLVAPVVVRPAVLTVPTAKPSVSR